MRKTQISLNETEIKFLQENIRFNFSFENILFSSKQDSCNNQTFHKNCNGKGNTLTLISLTNGSLFGGYTPLPWNSNKEYSQDNSLKSFIFRLRESNNQNLNQTPIICKLKSDQKQYAIYGGPYCGPTFGESYLYV